MEQLQNHFSRLSSPKLHPFTCMRAPQIQHTFYQNIGSSLLVFSLPQEKPLVLLQNVLTFSERLQHTPMRPVCRFHAAFNSNSPLFLRPNTENSFQLYTCSTDHGFIVQKRKQQTKQNKKSPKTTHHCFGHTCSLLQLNTGQRNNCTGTELGVRESRWEQ